eukprot:Skav220330  [mRNA]  locus=scaffold4895:5745:9002:- [translate_table: standard]
MPSTAALRIARQRGENIQEIIDVAFESFKDESGYITTERLKEAFEAIDQLGDISDIQMLLDSIDQDGDGKIDEDEFRYIMTRKFLGEDDDASLVLEELPELM